MSDFYFYLHFELIADLRLNLYKSSNQPSPPVHIMVNPNRGGAWRGSYVNGRGGPRSVVTQNPTTHVDSGVSPGVSMPSQNNSNRGGILPRGGGGGGRGFRGRGFGPGVDRGRGIPRGGLRGGRGRGSFAAAPQVVS